MLLVSIKQGLATDPIAQVHLHHLREHQPHPDSKDDPWLLSKDGEFLLFKGALFVPDHADVQLDVLDPITTIALRGTQAWGKRLVTSDASSTGPDWSDLSPTMCGPAPLVAEANPSITSLLVPFDSS